jgi:hypothetical protein
MTAMPVLIVDGIENLLSENLERRHCSRPTLAHTFDVVLLQGHVALQVLYLALLRGAGSARTKARSRIERMGFITASSKDEDRGSSPLGERIRPTVFAESTTS